MRDRAAKYIVNKFVLKNLININSEIIVIPLFQQSIDLKAKVHFSFTFNLDIDF